MSAQLWRTLSAASLVTMTLAGGAIGQQDEKLGKVAFSTSCDPKVQAELSDEKSLKTVKDGITENGKERMKPYQDKLTDDEIKGLIAHIRAFEKK